MKVVEGHWVTINGTHVFIGGNGRVQKGPKNLIGMTKEGVAEKQKNKYAKPKKVIHGGRYATGMFLSDEEHQANIRSNVKEYKTKKEAEKVYQQIKAERKNIHPALQDKFSENLSLLGSKGFNSPKDVADYTKYVHKETQKHTKDYNKPIGPRSNASRPLSAARTNNKRGIYTGKPNTGNPHFDNTVAYYFAKGEKLPNYKGWK